MSSLILPGDWTRQPPVINGVNRGYPLGRAITHCLPLNGNDREIVNGGRITRTNGTYGVDGRGVSLRSAGASSCASIPLTLSSYTSLTVSFWLYWDAFANDDKFAMEYGLNFSYQGFLIVPNASSGGLEAGVGGSGSPANNWRCARPSAGAWHHYLVAFNRDTGTQRSTSIFIDGVEQSYTAVGTTADVTNNFGNNTLFLFSRNNSSYYGAGRLQNLVLRAGYLGTAWDAREEFLSPWQIFQPLPRRIFAVSAAGGTSVTADGALPAANLTAATGSATGAATASGSLAAASLTAPTGSATGSATTSGNLQAISLSAPTGSAATAGSAAADGALTVIGLTAPDATATISIQAQAALAAIFLTPAEGSATGSAVCSGDFAPISLTACRASASNGLESAEALRKSVFLKISNPSYVIRV